MGFHLHHFMNSRRGNLQRASLAEVDVLDFSPDHADWPKSDDDLPPLAGLHRHVSCQNCSRLPPISDRERLQFSWTGGDPDMESRPFLVLLLVLGTNTGVCTKRRDNDQQLD